MGLLGKVKKGTTELTSKNTSDKVSKEAKEEIHYMKSDIKDLGKQLKTKEAVVVKTDSYGILHSGPKNQESFFSEFENFTQDGYVLTGITETKGLPMTPFGLDIKSGKLFFFQHKKFITNSQSKN